MRQGLGLIASLLLLSAGTLRGAEYVVSPQGDDGGDGSAAKPWKTIAHAAGRAAAGDTVKVLPGVYDELVTVTTSGAEGKAITLRAEPSRKARVKGFVLRGDWISIEGFEITSDAENADGIFAGESHRKTARTGCRMIGNFIHDIGGTGILTGERAVVRGNLIRNVFRGAWVNGGTLFEDNEVDTLAPRLTEKDGKTVATKTQYTFFAGDDITFRGNYFHGAPEKHLITGMGVDFFTTWDAWIIGSSHRILIENNRCFDATHGSEPLATVRKESSHITYRNNLFANTVYVGIMPKAWTHVTIENNTLINCGAYPVWLQGPQCETAVVRNNLIAYRGRERVVKEFGWKEPDAGIRIDTQGPRGVCDYNMFHGTPNRNYGEHDFTAEPQFMDPDTGDFRLRAGSPGIDAGLAIDGIKTDLRGIARPQGKGFDVGCYEKAAAEW